jgi:hypothetical protein
MPALVRSSKSLRRNPFIGCATIELWFTGGNFKKVLS